MRSFLTVTEKSEKRSTEFNWQKKNQRHDNEIKFNREDSWTFTPFKCGKSNID